MAARALVAALRAAGLGDRGPLCAPIHIRGAIAARVSLLRARPLHAQERRPALQDADDSGVARVQNRRALWLILIVVIAAVPFATVLLTGRPAIVVGVGAALAVIEWVWAYLDSRDPPPGSETTPWGLTLVSTSSSALIGLGCWIAGSITGAFARHGAMRGRI